MRPVGIGVVRIELTVEIDATLADMVARACAEHPNHSLEIVLDAPGGDWSASLAIFTNLKAHGRRVTALIERAASGGALVVMACDVRKLQPWGHFWLHRPQGPYPQAILDGIADRKAALMASGCRVPASRIRKWMDEVTTIDAKRALSYGLATEVPGLSAPKHLAVFL